VIQAPATARRWRAFADAVALALGANVWISIVILPASFVGALRSAVLLALAALPLAVLLIGLGRRSERVLLGLFPAALLVPIAVRPDLASPHVYGPIRFTVVALGLVAYLLGVSFFTSFHEPPAPVSVRPLSSSQAPVPVRWRRRERIYWALVAASVVFPASLLWHVNFDESVQALIGQMYPGRVALMTALFDVGVIVAWLGLYLHVFLGALRPHRTGDRDLVTAIGLIQADARRGRPRGRFYVGVAAALASMALLLLLRHM